MKYKKSIILLVLAIFIFGVASVCASDVNDNVLASDNAGQMVLSADNEITDDTLQINEENGTLTQSNNYESLGVETDTGVLSADEEGNYSDLRKDIENGGNLTKNYYRYNTGDGNTIEITNPLMVINGNGAIIDMAGSPSMRVFNVNSSGVTIKNLTIKNANYSGNGGAIYFASFGTVENCNFINNYATGDGGALNMDSGSVVDCNFTDNSVTGDGGALMIGDGSIENCIFTNNKGEYGCFGGAIHVNKNSTTDVINCNFINNTAAYGGAVYFNDNFAGEVVGCNFTNNMVSGDNALGGSLFFFENGTVSDCNFVNNSAKLGGAINMDSGSVTNCNFTDNIAYTEGGAVYLYFNANVTNCNFINNAANQSGGALYVYSAFSNSEIDSIFTNNSAKNGGAIYFNDKVNNAAINSIFAANNAERAGGAIFVRGQSLNNNFSSEFYDNRANKASGGAIFFSNFAESNSFEGIFADNYALYGGAVFFYKPANDNEFDADFTSNVAKSCGGAMFFYSTTDSNSFAGCFINNSALGQVDDSVGNGGAITFKNTSSNSVFTCDFINNTAALNGGGVNYRQTPYNITFNSNFINNTSPRGGGVNFFVNFENVVFNGEFIGNSANNGGAIAAREGIIENVSFKDNRAEYGGAVYAESGEIRNCDFANNTASDYGGAIIINGTGAVINCNFTKNIAEFGGAIDFERNGTVMNCNFINNTAACGSAVYFSRTGNLTDSYFADNTANATGTVHFFNTGAVTNCNFINNTARYYSGAIDFAEDATLINCNFTNNRANIHGGAINCEENVTLINCNFEGNSAFRGSAIYLDEYSSSNVIFNSSFLNNRANANDTAPFNVTINDNSIEIVFMGQDNLINAIYSQNDVVFSNVTYWGAEGIANTDNSTPSRSNREAGQNITVVGVVNGNIINVTKVTDENGTVVLENVSNCWIVVRHDADSYYTEAEEIISQNMTFNVNVTSQTTNNKTVNITAESNIFNEVIPGNLLFILPDGSQINATYGDNGTWWVEYTFSEYGEFNVTASYVGLDNVTVSNGTINITKADSTITLEDIVMNYGESINVTAITTGATAITAKIDGNDVDVNNFTIPISGLDIGNYTLTVTTIPDSDHNPVNKTVTITVNDYIIVSAPDVTLYYSGDERFVVIVTDSKNNPLANQSVSITLNGATYNRTTNVNGTASMAISLISGQYNVTTVACNNTVYSNITVLSTVNTTDLVKVFRNATQFYATFKDSKGNYLAEGTMVRFNINGVMYDRKVSGNNGLAKLNINLEQGHYIITSMNLETGENAANNVTVISRLIENNDITKYYRNATQYTVKVIGGDGKAVGAGETVTFNVNGVFYNRITNESGIAKLNINLHPGDYVVTAEYDGCRVSNNIKVLPILSASELTKKYGTSDPFVATLVDGQGKAFARETIQFNVNGVLYNRVTDSKGQSKLSINLQPGKYIITSSYNGTSIANNITILS